MVVLQAPGRQSRRSTDPAPIKAEEIRRVVSPETRARPNTERCVFISTGIDDAEQCPTQLSWLGPLQVH